MNKILGVLIVVVAGHFLFFNHSAATQVHVNGHEYGPKVLNKTNDSASKIYTYKSNKPDTSDYVAIVYPDSGTGSLDSWVDLLAAQFTRNGFTFESVGAYKQGRNGSQEIFLVPLTGDNVVAMYMVGDRNTSLLPQDGSAFEVVSQLQLQ